MDESGTTRRDSTLSVAGVIIHGDQQSTAVQAKLNILIEKHIPYEDRVGFVFHATDIYHGSKYFDRRVWEQDRRFKILRDLSSIIAEFHLPIVVSAYVKETFGLGVIPADIDDGFKAMLIQSAAVMDCAVQADRWLAQFSSTENAMLIAEDIDRVKALIKRIFLVLRHPGRMKAEGLESIAQEFDLPLKRIVDTVHFAAKEDCAPLQIADLCAFCIGRSLKGKPVPDGVLGPIVDHARWLKIGRS